MNIPRRTPSRLPPTGEAALVDQRNNSLPADTGLARRSARALASAVMQRPWRVWMSGSLALVMLAFGAADRVDDPDRHPRLLRLSPYSVQETLVRIERAAQEQGLSVMARLPGDQPLLVLASAAGGTPVMLQAGSPSPDLPLSLRLRVGADGQVAVLAPDHRPALAAAPQDLPVEVARDLAALPGWVARALG